MNKEQYDNIVTTVRAHHLEKFNGNTIEHQILRILYEEIDNEFVAAGEVTQAEYEADLILEILQVGND